MRTIEGRVQIVAGPAVEAFRDGIEVVAMDGFTGFKTAAVEELPAAVEVMDPFHVVKLAGDSLDEVRRRVQQETTGHRGKKATRCIRPGGLCTPGVSYSPSGSSNGSSLSLLMRIMLMWR